MKVKQMYRYLIIGAGPAGLQLAYFLEKAGHDYLVLEGGTSPGSFFKHFPRQRGLISINKRYTGYEDPEINLRWDWNSLLSDSEELLMKHYSKSYFPKADTLVKYLGDFADHFGLNIEYNSRVVKISKDEVFEVVDQNGTRYSCRNLVVATGLSKPYIPPIPGIEFAESYESVSTDPEDFCNQRVLIIGKGNSAFEIADNLLSTAAVIHLCSPEPLKMAWQSHFVGHLRAVNNNILDTYQLKSQNAVFDAEIDRIEREGNQFRVSVSYLHAHGEKETLLYDRVITCTGFQLDQSIFDETCRPATAVGNRLPAQTSAWESVNIEGLYFSGSLTQMRDYKKSTSAFIHGFRYNCRALYRILEQRNHQKPWPKRVLDNDAQALTDAVIQRVNRTSALWQLFGFLADVVSVDGDQAAYYEEIPVDYVHDGPLGRSGHYYLVTLEYGPHHETNDPFNVTRIDRNDAAHADQSNFLHPVIRYFSGDKLVEEHHIIEDLESSWIEDVHVQPLLTFFRNTLPTHELSPTP
ncbi:MAG: NAD(P)-binding domain-containing protein [Acidobacteriota bacterium]|nr:NAD(P)-binding domain-containing protein [Acidobacteriota bacterium]